MYLHPGEAVGSGDYPGLPKDGSFAQMPGGNLQADLPPYLLPSGWKGTWKGPGVGGSGSAETTWEGTKKTHLYYPRILLTIKPRSYSLNISFVPGTLLDTWE